MRRQGLQARCKGRFRPRTTDSRHGGPIAPHLLLGAAPPTRPNQVWVTDITYIQTTEGWRYLSATLDLCTRKIIAWNLYDTMETILCTTTLQRALEASRPDTHALIYHCLTRPLLVRPAGCLAAGYLAPLGSDRGVQYASMEFRYQLTLSGITQSMSRGV